MSDLSIVWAPRVVLTNRTIRIPVASSDDSVEIVADSCELVGRRWSAPESTAYFYLQTPREPGDVVVHARRSGSHSKRTVQVRDLNQLREPDEYNGAQWPRRWPLGQHYKSVKSRQTLQDEPRSSKVDEEAVSWWLAQPDEQIWRQLPNAELPKAHFVNAHQGCPVCGTAVYRYSGFYPWVRNHAPCDFRSTCPSCDSVFPSNNLMSQDFGSGPHPDDGFGYFDEEGHIWLFAATYHRDQCRSFAAGVSTIVNHLRAGVWDDRTARCLAMMMLRYAEEEAYVAAAPQFRYGPSRGLEEKWQGGQPDWAAEPDPVRALARKGSLRYSIDTPKVGELMAVAYDTIWPLLREDRDPKASVFILCGANVADSLGVDPVGLTLESVLARRIMDRIGQVCGKALREGYPVRAEGSYRTDDGGEARYRSIFMPARSVGKLDDGYVFGTFGQKIVPLGERYVA